MEDIKNILVPLTLTKASKNILDYEVELIRRKGVRFVYNCRVGKDITLEKMRQDNDAVFIGIGAQSVGMVPVNLQHRHQSLHPEEQHIFRFLQQDHYLPMDKSLDRMPHWNLF